MSPSHLRKRADPNRDRRRVTETNWREDNAGRVILIAGPTASGKSALGLLLAERLRGIVINADSMQVYRELSILTARPSAPDEARAPHALYGVLSANQPGSAAGWVDLARNAIGDAFSAGRTPILVGGTGLYFRALLEGLAPVPDIPPEIRTEVRSLQGERGSAGLYSALKDEDPAMAERLSPGDSQRLSRALETARATGRSLADWQKAEPEGGLAVELGPERIRRVLLVPDRAELYARLDARFLDMMKAGALAEAKALSDLGLDEALPAMKAVGVRELIAHSKGETTLDEAIALAQTATRQYAKRQMTWFRNQFADWPTVELKESERNADKEANLITRMLRL